jgi:hypothetical protein
MKMINKEWKNSNNSRKITMKTANQWFELKKAPADFGGTEFRLVEKDNHGYSGLSGQWEDTPQGYRDAIIALIEQHNLYYPNQPIIVAPQ